MELTQLQAAYTELCIEVERLRAENARLALPAAAVPVSPAMVAATCAAHGSFDPRCETCPHCLHEQSIRRLSAVPVSPQEELPPRPWRLDERDVEEHGAYGYSVLSATGSVVVDHCSLDVTMRSEPHRRPRPQKSEKS